ERAILLLKRGLQPALHIQQDPSLVGVSAYRSQHQLVGYRVEEGSDIEIDHPAPSPAPLSTDSHRLQRRPSWPIAVRVGVKQRLHLRLQIQAYDRLGDTVCHRGHAEDSDLALLVLLGYFD